MRYPSRITDADPAYLLTEQYKTAVNLNARLGLHEGYSANPHGFHCWALDQFDLPPRSRVLEIGCGPGMLWVRNADRIAAGWKITLTDFSAGMLAEARRNLVGAGHDFSHVQADAQAIPFPDACFDAVIANHMLYHVPDRARAFAEVRRVLRPGGAFYAATNGAGHLRELDEAIQRVAPSLPDRISGNAFSLENGMDQLTRWFVNVDLRLYEDSLAVTAVQPLLDYVRSWGDGLFSAAQLDTLRRFWQQQIDSSGAVSVAKSSGMFVARAGAV